MSPGRSAIKLTTLTPSNSYFVFRYRTKSMNFKVLLQEAEEGGYIVGCPVLPGCHSQGDTAEEALENIKEAIVGCLESLAEERTLALGSQGRIVVVADLISDVQKIACNIWQGSCEGLHKNRLASGSRRRKSCRDEEGRLM